MTSLTGNSAQSSRINMRLSPAQRALIDRAATLKGTTLTQWALTNLMNSAKRDIEEETTLLLNEKAFSDFEQALNQPFSPEAKNFLAQTPHWS